MDKTFLRLTSPRREKGMATLRIDNEMWNFLPKTNKVMKIPPSMMMGSWMGTDFTNDDLVRQSSFEEDYVSEYVWPSTDPPVWKIRLDARPDVVGLWNRVEVVFSYEHELPVLAQYYDRKDRLSRTMRFEEIRELGNRLIPTVTIIVPEREEGRSTRLEYFDVQFDVEMDEGTFSLSRLERKH